MVEDYPSTQPGYYNYYDACYLPDPYYSAPEYCDELPYQQATCCTWHVGYDCYEEWCVWADTCSWAKVSYNCYY